MKINVQYGRDSGVNKEEFQEALEGFVYDWLDVDEELIIEVTLDGRSEESADGLPD